MKKLHYILITGALFFSGCESIIQDFPINDPSPKLAVYSFAGTDSSLKVYVSRNMNLNENFGLNPQTNALVELYKGTELLSSPKVDDFNFFTDTSFKFEQNSEYTLKVSNEGYPSTETNFYIPKKPIVYSIDTAIVWSSTPDCPECAIVPGLKITIRFENPPETIDYFSIDVTRNSYVYDYYSPNMVDPDTIIYNYRLGIKSNAPYIKTVQSWDGYNNASQFTENDGERFFFSDELLEEGENTLIIEVETYSLANRFSEEDPQPLTVNFTKIDENLMEYANSKGKARLAEDSPFVEPVTIFSNVENGLGLVTGYSIYNKTFSTDSISKLIPEENFSY